MFADRHNIFILAPLAMIFILTACGARNLYDTEIEALQNFPGYLNDQNAASLAILSRVDIPAGEATGEYPGAVLLYTYEGIRSNEQGQTCLAVTFLSQRNVHWRAESSGKLGCDAAYARPQTISLSYLIGGNIRDLTTVFGLAPGAHSAHVQWADGLETRAPIVDGALLLARTESIAPHTVRLEDAAGNALHTEAYR